MSQEELNQIQLNNLAVPGKYYTLDGTSNVYIGTPIKRLRLLSNAELVIFNSTNNNSATNVQQAIEDIDEGTVKSVTGLDTNNTDPNNPIVKIAVDGSTITGNGTLISPLVANITPGYISSVSDTGTITLDVTGGNLTADFFTLNISQFTNDSGYITSTGITPAALSKTDDTNVTLTLGGSPNTALLQATSLTLGWTGTLADVRIASASTWNAKQTAYTILSTLGLLSNSSGVLTNNGSGTLSWTAPTTGTVTSVSGTINRITSTGGATPVIDISSSYVGQSSITTLGTITTGTWNGSLLTGTYGGTGVNNGSATLTMATSTTITGGGTVALGGFTLTIPATGTVPLGTGSTNALAYWSGTNTLTSNSNLVQSSTAGVILTMSGTGLVGYRTTNSSSNTAAVGAVQVQNATISTNLLTYGGSYTTAGLLVANLGALTTTSTVGLFHNVGSGGSYMVVY